MLPVADHLIKIIFSSLCSISSYQSVLTFSGTTDQKRQIRAGNSRFEILAGLAAFGERQRLWLICLARRHDRSRLHWGHHGCDHFGRRAARAGVAGARRRPDDPLRSGPGDVLVMGGSGQRMWEHAVPKMHRPIGPRISIQFRPAGGRW